MARRVLYLLCAAGLAVAACGSPDPAKPTPTLAAEPDWLYADLGEQYIKVARSLVQKVLETLPSNRGLRWRGDNGVIITVTPLRTFKIKTGHFCRDYLEVVAFDSAESSASRRACRNEGIWIQVPTDSETSL